MGWRGAVRSLAATGRRVERAQQRRHRELIKQQEQHNKLEASHRAALEVEAYNNYIELITSIHCDCGDIWDWNHVKATPPPQPPASSRELEDAQRQKAESFHPGLFDRLLGRVEAKNAAFERSIEEARTADTARHATLMKEYESKLADWESLQKLAAGVLSGQVEAFKEALLELAPFKNIGEIGSPVNLNFNEHYAEATITLHGQDRLVPREAKTLLKSGKVSAKAATASFINQTYQTHVCSCALRSARELFAVLPFKKVFVHGTTQLLNAQTGNMESATVLSVLIPRETCERLNFENVSPAECMKNFVHNMSFSATRGFASVAKLNPAQFESSQPVEPSTSKTADKT